MIKNTVVEYRPCNKCGETNRRLSISISKHTGNELRQLRCMTCERTYREDNKKKISERARIYAKNNPDKYKEAKKRQSLYRKTPEGKIALLVRSAKGRAKNNSMEFDITTEDIKMTHTCPLLEIPLKWNNKKTSQDSPSLDRIDNSKGYIKGNVWIISHRANTLKRNATINELITMSKNIPHHISLA